jgi:hypothetical protein
LKILFAASENAWGGFLNRVKKLLPDHEFMQRVGLKLQI